jgi:hypothetical protein
MRRIRNEGTGDMKVTQQTLPRRAFLLAATAGAAATATAIALGKKDVASPSQHESGQSARGYRLSEHVRNYYRTARI